IYDGLSATYDYGQYGSELKNNIKEYWWKAITRLHENIVGIDAAIFMHPTTWKASGHVDAFNEEQFRATNPNVLRNQEKINNVEGRMKAALEASDLVGLKQLIEDLEIADPETGSRNWTEVRQFNLMFSTELGSVAGDAATIYLRPETAQGIFVNFLNVQKSGRMKAALEASDLVGLKQLIEDLEIADPETGSRNWTEVRQFNLMFSTELGSVAGDAATIYLRPETAQGIFVNFLNVQKSGRMKIPFGIAQIGKAFRNEIIARQFIFRMREFEQMEMQFFIKPGTDGEWYNYWKDARIKWHKSLGMGEENYKFHDHLKLAHYANAACDIEFNFPMGFKELEGIHSRTDFDLGNHEKFSGKKLRYHETESGESYVPYVIETSIGLDRMFLATLTYAYNEETLEYGSERVVLSIPPALAPVKVAVLPLLNKDGLPEKAREIVDQLKLYFNLQYDAKDAIGRRYRRQDAIGTPYCITIDHDTLTDHCVTIRERDSMQQERVSIERVREMVEAKVSMNTLLAKLA
ncbi:MAG: glycine--tRNA ligase, partial [Flavobacteriales bacterium]